MAIVYFYLSTQKSNYYNIQSSSSSLYLQYLWEDLVIEYQHVKLFEISTMFVKLIFHYTENLHVHSLICDNALCMFGK